MIEMDVPVWEAKRTEESSMTALPSWRPTPRPAR